MMTSSYDTFTSPLSSRNASKQMLAIWSPRHKFNSWRRVWLAVAEAQCELGLPVSKEQVAELRGVVERAGGISDEEMKLAEKYERELRHDVMAHVHALGDQCPKAKGIIHLGMTSQDVVCNADLMLIGEATKLIEAKIVRLMGDLAEQARKHASVPTLGFTHYQPAQPVTVGRRCAGWAAELGLVQARLGVGYEQVFRGLRGATGTQASFLALFGEAGGVDAMERRSLQAMAGAGAETFALTGQTYPRVVDTFVLADLASAASVLHKVATDIRLLCNRKELDEPFESKQIGSSAMPYKRNPMRCERVCGLARFVMNLVGNGYDTAATQWLERTLDDSSNRRMSLPEAFLALDGALDIMHNVVSGLIVHEAMVRRNLMAELPFMATENILMECVKRGGDRQAYHEHIRVHAQAAGLAVKQEGLENDLIERLKADKHFKSKAQGGTLESELDWAGVLDPMKYIGRSVEQTRAFVARVDDLRKKHSMQLAALEEAELRV
jgi:adenylosuccinate lyase